MRDRENTGPALGSEAVDDQFWALICEDEGWLRAEFDAIVSEPVEVRRRPGRRRAVGSEAIADRPRAARGGRCALDRRSVPLGEQWRRERSPP